MAEPSPLVITLDNALKVMNSKAITTLIDVFGGTIPDDGKVHHPVTGELGKLLNLEKNPAINGKLVKDCREAAVLLKAEKTHAGSAHCYKFADREVLVRALFVAADTITQVCLGLCTVCCRRHHYTGEWAVLHS